MRLLCFFGLHWYRRMTSGRGMFVHHELCRWGCGTQRIRKGKW